MVLLKKVGLINYTNKEELYSKLVRKSPEFCVEIHNLQDSKNLQIRLLRNHHSIERIIKSCDKTDIITNLKYELDVKGSIVKLNINEDTFMVDTGSKCHIVVNEYNVTKDFSDFEKGKAAIIIDFFFETQMETSKVRGEMKTKFCKEEVIEKGE